MNKILIGITGIIALLTLSGCRTPHCPPVTEYYAAQEYVEITPAAGDIATAHAGETITSKSKYDYYQGIELLSPVMYYRGMGIDYSAANLYAQPGFYPLIGQTTKGFMYEADGKISRSTKKNTIGTPVGNAGLIIPSGESCGYIFFDETCSAPEYTTVSTNYIDGFAFTSVDYTPGYCNDVIDSSDQAFPLNYRTLPIEELPKILKKHKEITFDGRTESALHFSYAEFLGPKKQERYRQDLVLNNKSGDIITIRGCKFKLLEIQDNAIKYQLIRELP